MLLRATSFKRCVVYFQSGRAAINLVRDSACVDEIAVAVVSAALPSQYVRGFMQFSIDNLAEHAGVPLESLKALSSNLPVGAGRLYESETHRKMRGGIREIFKPQPPSQLHRPLAV
jgi:hypothetical protein